jgi:formate dehydrogenase
LRKWIEEQGHTLVTTSDKEGENSKFDQELVDAEVIITTPYVAPLFQATPHHRFGQPRNDMHPTILCNRSPALSAIGGIP